MTTESPPLNGRTGTAGGKPQIVLWGTRTAAEHPSVLPDAPEVYEFGTELLAPPTDLNEAAALHEEIGSTFGPTIVRTLGRIERLASRAG